MSRLSRAYPDDPDAWAHPPLHPPTQRRRCWCGQAVTESSACGCCCIDHENTEDAS